MVERFAQLPAEEPMRWELVHGELVRMGNSGFLYERVKSNALTHYLLAGPQPLAGELQWLAAALRTCVRRPWMVWRASYNLLRTPLTGIGADIDPDFNISANTVSSASRTGGVNPGPVNLITNLSGYSSSESRK